MSKFAELPTQKFMIYRFRTMKLTEWQKGYLVGRAKGVWEPCMEVTAHSPWEACWEARLKFKDTKMRFCWNKFKAIPTWERRGDDLES